MKKDISELQAKMAEVSEDQLKLYFDRISTIRLWCDAVEAEVRDRLTSGKGVSGLKLIQGRALARKWDKADEVERILLDAAVAHDVVYKTTLQTPTQVEGALKKANPELWEKVNFFVSQGRADPAIVPESDKRPAFVPGADDFSIVD